MNTILNQLSEYLWLQSWQVAILIGAAFILCRALRHKSAHLRYMIWLMVLAKCLVPPIFHVPVALLPAEAMVQPEQTQGLIDFDLEAPSSGSEETVASEPTKASWHSRELALVQRHWIVMIWGVIAILVYVINAFRMVRIRSHLHRHRTAVSESVQNDLNLVCDRFGLSKRPQVWLFSQTDQPFVWGWFAGTIYIPDEFESKAPEQRRAILAHELAHVCRYDAAVNLLQVLAQSLFWFHPLVWWANAQIRTEREQCCDETAIAHMNIDVKTYCNALISHLVAPKRNPLPMASLAISSPVKHIEQRIKTIMKETHFRTRPPVMAVLTIVLVALLLISTSCSLCHKQTIEAPIQLEDANNTQEKIFFEAIVFECSNEEQEITSFLNEEEIMLSESGVSYSHLTAEQQKRLKNLPNIKFISSPGGCSAATEDGMPVDMVVMYEEYYQSHPSNPVTSVTWGTKIDVTPHLDEEHDSIVIELRLEKTDVIPTSRKSGLPTITKRMSSNTFALDKGTSMLILQPIAQDNITSGVILSAKKITVGAGQVELTD